MNNIYPMVAALVLLVPGIGLDAQIPTSDSAGEKTISTDDQVTRIDDQTITIPFKLTKANNISIKATINKTGAVNLMFHTAVDSVSLTREATKRLTNLKFDQIADVESWGGATTARHSSNNSMQIGSLNWDDVSVTEDLLSGSLTDGKFGPNLFKGKVIEIDFDKRVLIIHDSLPIIDSAYERLELVPNRRSMFVVGQVRIGTKKINNEFMIHSGFSGTVMLDDEFVDHHEIGSKLDMVRESELRDSYGNVLKTKHVLLPELSLGKATFSDVPIQFFDGAIGKQKMSVVGGDILKRFNIILDLQNSQIYLKPNSLFKSPFGS